MKITTVLFDLDGTLLPMNMDEFIKAYFGNLAKKLSPFGYEPEKLIKAIWSGTGAMVKNNGTCTNEEAFWQDFCGIFGEQARNDIPHFDEFYRTDFQKVKEVCGFAPEAEQVVSLLKEKGIAAVLATNPIFPAVATESRIRWAGLNPEDFLLYTTYENSNYCKPNLKYYEQILTRLNLRAEECLMVGNDVDEDMVAQELGMQVFLLTPCILNRHNRDISSYPQGDFSDLIRYLNQIL